mmetsp:Transcript_56669/g.130257  ORF Transcript_56669/g.130257 Transcript_56669/m.130257 type:complete len:254 (-) Transcript_56669:738-1499(-)
MQGHVIIHDAIYAVNVNTPRSDVSGHQNLGPPGAELLQSLVSACLVLVRVKAIAAKSSGANLSAQFVCSQLGPRENQQLLSSALCVQPLKEHRLLVDLRNHHHPLQNVRIGAQLGGSHFDLHGVLSAKLTGKRLDPPWPGRTPHQCLSVGPNLRLNHDQCLIKPHIQHAISFIQHKICHPSQICGAILEELKQSPRGCYTNFRALLQTVYLGVPGYPAIDRHRLLQRSPTEESQCSLNLQYQFPCGCQDDNDR